MKNIKPEIIEALGHLGMTSAYGLSSHLGETVAEVKWQLGTLKRVGIASPVWPTGCNSAYPFWVLENRKDSSP